MLHKYTILLFALLIPLYGFSVLAEDDHENEVQETHATDDHDNDHKSEIDTDDHDENEEELVIELTPETMKLAGISISNVEHGRIAQTIELPGEIQFNEDRVAHIAPRFAGIAQKAKFRVGDYVNKGEVVAIVESNESLNSYSIKAPISGWIIDRHITTGEFVSEENSIYIIADLSTVWVNLAIYQKDCSLYK